MPAGARPRVVVAREISFEDEVIVDAVRCVDLISLTARVALGSQDVVLSLGKIKPVFSPVVELKPKLGAAVVLRNAIPHPEVNHLALTVDGRFKRIAHQAAEWRRLAIGTRAHPVAACEQIKVAKRSLQVHAIEIDV